MKTKNKIANKHFDWMLGLLVIGLAIFGCIMVYSASMYSAQISYGDKFYFLKKQIFGVVMGIICMVIFSFIDYKKYAKFRYAFLAVGLALLVIVLIPGLSRESYGARRWISILGFSFQPSEVSKFCFVFFSASTLAKNPNNHQTFLGNIEVIISGALTCVLIMLEPNMSVTMLVAFVMLIMLFIGGLKLNRFAYLSLPAMAGVVGLILIEPYRLKRLSAFLDPWANPLGEGYQLIQSLYSFGNGGLFGVGLFCSRQKYLFLPFSESDFIFSIIGEELGLIGCGIVLIVFAFIVIKTIKVALNSTDRFGTYLSCGIASVIAVQVLINIAVVTGSIPPTGLPLPFISAGSTSLLVFMSAIGVVLNVDRQSRKVS